MVSHHDDETHAPTDAVGRDARLRAFRKETGLDDLSLDDLDWALTHRSYAYEAELEADNERLEFLGDAVLDMLVAEALYLDDPEAPEGTLTKRRARLVSRATLGRRALDMGLEELILLGRGERATGGGRRRSILGSAIEALVGAIHLRLGLDDARRFVHAQVLEPLGMRNDAEREPGDCKSVLQEWCQARHKRVPVYTRLSEEGPDHAKTFKVQVEIAGRVLACGIGPKIKSAENDAARRALITLEEDNASSPSP